MALQACRGYGGSMHREPFARLKNSAGTPMLP